MRVWVLSLRSLDRLEDATEVEVFSSLQSVYDYCDPEVNVWFFNELTTEQREMMGCDKSFIIDDTLEVYCRLMEVR